MLFPFPYHAATRLHLPLELEREVCQFAVFSFLECTPRIILVAVRFYDWSGLVRLEFQHRIDHHYLDSRLKPELTARLVYIDISLSWLSEHRTHGRFVRRCIPTGHTADVPQAWRMLYYKRFKKEGCWAPDYGADPRRHRKAEAF